MAPMICPRLARSLRFIRFAHENPLDCRIVKALKRVDFSSRLENLNGPIKFINGKIDIVMAKQATESKKLLSYTIAEWACALKYEDLSPEAIQAAKLFWFDSIGCALGGSQQDDAKILLKHYRAMSATADSSGGEGGNTKGRATAF